MECKNDKDAAAQYRLTRLKENKPSAKASNIFSKLPTGTCPTAPKSKNRRNVLKYQARIINISISVSPSRQVVVVVFNLRLGKHQKYSYLTTLMATRPHA